MTTSESDLQRAEAALVASHLQLQQAQELEAIGQLAGSLAHDFNNLVTVILGYTDMSLRRSDLDDSIHHNLEETRKAGEARRP